LKLIATGFPGIAQKKRPFHSTISRRTGGTIKFDGGKKMRAARGEVHPLVRFGPEYFTVVAFQLHAVEFIANEDGI
jgi:hypothetical protein